MVSTRSLPTIRARRLVKSRRFLTKTISGTFIIDESLTYKEMYVTQASALSPAQLRLWTQAPREHMRNGTYATQRSPLLMRQLDTIHVIQTLCRIVVTNVSTGCRRQIVHVVRRIQRKCIQQHLTFGHAMACNNDATEDIKGLTANSGSSSCDGHHGKGF